MPSTGIQNCRLTHLDAKELLEVELPKPSLVDRAFVYLDPPYYAKGSQLYLNHYKPEDHATLATFLASAKFAWVMSYDNTPEIPQTLQGVPKKPLFNLGYKLCEWKIGKELMIVPPRICSSRWRGRSASLTGSSRQPTT